MTCIHCGFENLDTATYCSGCGQKIETEKLDVNDDIETVQPMEVSSQKFEKNNRRVLLAVIIVLVLGLVAAGIYVVAKPDYLELAKESYEIKDYATFERATNNFSEEQIAAYDEFILNEMMLVFEAFKAEAVYYKDAVRQLKDMQSYVLKEEKYTTILNSLETLNSSRIAYAEGREWLEAKEWENAKASFLKVSEEDANYESALRYLESIKRWQLQEIASKASTYAEAGDYESALGEIEKGLVIDPENEILLNLVDAIELAMTQPPVEEEEVGQPGLGEVIKSGLDSLGDSIKSFFNGIFSW
ncbi:MAG TPA: zinc ribbon domain-containing protein [Firmicutes bacterium]|nr:zinc ribbon domain-containing protein [Bacillota bacterium]